MARPPMAPDGLDVVSHHRRARLRPCRHQRDGRVCTTGGCAAQSAIETQDAALAARIDVQAHTVADLDRRLGQIDFAIEEAARKPQSYTAGERTRLAISYRWDLAAGRSGG
jgi:hypothetical protein